MVVAKARQRAGWVALAAIAVSLLVSACGRNAADRFGDAAPHPAVAKAHTLPIHGIDVSRWQRNIDWASVAASGKRFAFIKATEGGDHIDPMFRQNWEGARRAGIPRSAYHFVYWCRPAHEQAAWFRQIVPRDPDALPPVLDVEWNGESRNCPRKVPRAQALAMIDLMLREMEAHTGKKPIIYTDITFHKEILEGEFRHHAHWIRSTAAEPHHRYNDRIWTLWQYTTTGRVPGIVGAVDRNVFYGGERDWAYFARTGCDPRHRCK
ncbi:glycoside hydrolase family 25 protein [Enterovirga rhinocerotis]|uniref:Lysozyme n=1 Tax=Enterovirga rhinocerotis TaxID=1339210 RepID=A0A4V3DYZ5_9HYPH|nr:GH25 family lysozyme [Enterovirga rhinocerotis]TDR94609.1 lysozyme [Enterovirga rhinocerotis]